MIMETPDEKTLREIFYSDQYHFGGDKDTINKLYFLLREKYIGFEKVTIASKTEYLNLLSNTDMLEKEYDADGGGLQHVALKLLARKYLKTFEVETRFEQPFCGYYPDVISTDKKIIIECGHTNNVDKIFTYFTQGDIKEFIQVPYPSDEDNHLYGYVFTSQNNLKGFLEFESKENRKRILGITNRKT